MLEEIKKDKNMSWTSTYDMLYNLACDAFPEGNIRVGSTTETLTIYKTNEKFWRLISNNMLNKLQLEKIVDNNLEFLTDRPMSDVVKVLDLLNNNKKKTRVVWGNNKL